MKFGLSVVAALLLGSCGYVGDPMPPALKIPVKIETLAAVQRGDQIIIQFVAPSMTTEGMVVDKLGGIDLRIGPGPNPWHEPTWADNASPVAVEDEPEPGPVRTATPAGEWEEREVIIAVRTSNPKGRWSVWSNLVALNVVQPVAAPEQIRAEPVGEGVRLNWQHSDAREGLKFQVYRRQEGSNAQALLGETEQTQWVDEGARFGESYSYRVLAVVPAGDDVAQSVLPEPVSATPTDIFPPPPPERLAAIAALNTIELNWEPSEDSGPVSYRIFRADGEGELRSIAEKIETPSYSDAAVISGTRYRYAVSALDEADNESEKSAIVEQVAP